jgi:hypothetical protein
MVQLYNDHWSDEPPITEDRKHGTPCQFRGDPQRACESVHRSMGRLGGRL